MNYSVHNFQFEKYMKTNETKEQKPADDKVVFVPTEDIRVIESVLNNWEQVKQEYRKIETETKKVSTAN
jgi:hypothetical protein